MCTMYIYYCRFGGGPRVQSLETCAVCEVCLTSCNLLWFHRVHVFNLCITNLHTYLYSVYVTQSVLGLNHNVITLFAYVQQGYVVGHIRLLFVHMWSKNQSVWGLTSRKSPAKCNLLLAL